MLLFLGRIWLAIKNRSLQSKLLLSYIVLLFIPILALSAYSYTNSSGVILEKSMDISRMYLEQTRQLVDEEFTKLIGISQVISQNADIRSLLEQNTQPLPFDAEFDEMADLRDTITNLQQLYGIHQIRLYISPTFRFSQSKHITYDITELEQEDWYQDMLRTGLTTAVTHPYLFKAPMAPETELISVVTLIRSYRDMENILGVVSVDVTVDSLREMLRQTAFTTEGVVQLVDNEQNVICQTGEPPKNQNLSKLREELSQEYNLEQVQVQSGGQVLGISSVLPGGLRIFSVIPMDALLVDSKDLLGSLLFFAVIVGALLYVLAYVLARYNTKRIRGLAALMRQAERGDFTVKCVVDSEDEIGELQSNFNFMVEKIHALLQERYNLGKTLKETELKALQAQINPHFLYNTLDLISWKAQGCGHPEISDIVFKMARFYQISLSKGSEFIKLSDEFQHIRLYVELQNLKRQFPIELETSMAPGTEELPIMKLLLQPIVENAIGHGIMDMEHPENGKVSIAAQVEGDRLQVVIADNGAGMDRGQLQAIRFHQQSKLMDSSAHGYGLFNIIDRLKAFYGDSYSFSIESALGEGTVVTISMPLVPPQL